VVGQTVQLLLDQREQRGERRLVTAAPLGEQLGDFVWSGVCQLKISSLMSVAQARTERNFSTFLRVFRRAEVASENYAAGVVFFGDGFRING